MQMIRSVTDIYPLHLGMQTLCIGNMEQHKNEAKDGTQPLGSTPKYCRKLSLHLLVCAGRVIWDVLNNLNLSSFCALRKPGYFPVFHFCNTRGHRCHTVHFLWV